MCIELHANESESAGLTDSQLVASSLKEAVFAIAYQHNAFVQNTLKVKLLLMAQPVLSE